MSSVFVEESTSSGTSARTWHAQVAAWLFRRKVGVMDVPTLKEANFFIFFLKEAFIFFLVEAAALGETPGWLAPHISSTQSSICSQGHPGLPCP